MSMKIAICEDNDIDAKYLQSLLEGYDTKLYTAAAQLLTDTEEKNRFDLYILDIYLDRMNGIELAKKLRELDEKAVICFISSSDAFYREAYDLYAIQYLLKPVKPEALIELVKRVENLGTGKSGCSLCFKWRGKMGSIPCDKILYVSSRVHKLTIYLADGTVQECIGKMDEMAHQTQESPLVRVHQSYLVNMDYVSSLNSGELTVADYRIPVSRRYAADVKKRYREMLFLKKG